MRKYVIAAAMALASTGAYAIDIVNQDSQDVTVSVYPTEAGPVTFRMKPGEVKRDACPQTVCDVYVGAENGEWTATSNMNDKVTIQGGKPALGR
jgi:hypothetical protein